MSLNDLYLLHQYRPNKSNIVDDFYIPCLQKSVLYQRAVGYFNSGSLATAAKGLSHFISTGGKMELIASPQLEEDDIEAIKMGYEAREDVINRVLLRGLPDKENPIVDQRLGFLAWMILNGQLEIKIAIVDDLDENMQGIYHEKIGCFHDAEGNIVAFTGSSNETKGGLYSNFELVEVFCSWREGDGVRVNNKLEDFSNLWENNTKNLRIIPFPKAVEEKLLQKQKYSKPGQNDPESVTSHAPAIGEVINKPYIPFELGIREYQKEAVIAWFKNNGSGIYSMATGSGKTITALITALKLYQRINRIGLVILCPYIELVDQWCEEAKRFGFKPIVAYESRRNWEHYLNSQIISYNMNTTDHFCVIMTNNTFLTSAMQDTLSKINQPAMIIADEAHHLGAAKLSSKLPKNISYRLALSATPERWFDEDGTRSLESYFSPGVIYEFSLKQAIDAGFLTKYRYFPHIVQLTEEEYLEYYTISKKIAQIIISNGGDLDLDLEEKGLQDLLIERARILSRAINKLGVLKSLVENERESNFNLFYCGDSKIGDERQIDLVVKLLGSEMGMKVHPFTSREDKKLRKELLENFGKGKLQGLVAIRCLDEGVDVPATRTAYILASSTNPREFVQRRGRVLRKYPGKEYSIIHDFIVVPRALDEIDLIEPQLFNLERKLVKRELTRVNEFASLAENGPFAMSQLKDLKSAYNLLDL